MPNLDPNIRKSLLANIKTDPSSFKKAPIEYQKMQPETDYLTFRDFLIDAVNENGLVLEFMTSSCAEVTVPNIWTRNWTFRPIKNDREIVLTAVKQNGLALEFAAAAMQRDREVVLVAVAQNGAALKYASDELKNNPFLQSVSRLGNVPELLLLIPIKEKLKKEKSTDIIFAANKMISSIENAIITWKGDKNNKQFKAAFHDAISQAKPVLGSLIEKQASWRVLIDDLINAIIKLLPAPIEKPVKPFAFFTEPNSVGKEIEEFKNLIPYP